jgi:tRNA acetyltransferase TAN1
LSRDVIIKKVAGLIDSERHPVSLEKPDKVILIEVYQVCATDIAFPCTTQSADRNEQNACGMSVVDGDYWDDLRKYNLTELYGLANKERGQEKAQAGEDKAQAVVPAVGPSGETQMSPS